MRYLRLLFLFVVFCFFIFSTCRLVGYCGNLFAVEMWKARIYCNEPLYVFGTISISNDPSAESTNPSHEFIIQNKGSRDLLIREVVAGCGSCVEVEGFTNTAIVPKGSGSVKLKLLTDSVSGKVAKDVLVKSNDPKHPNLVLTLEAEIVREQTNK